MQEVPSILSTGKFLLTSRLILSSALLFRENDKRITFMPAELRLMLDEFGYYFISRIRARNRSVVHRGAELYAQWVVALSRCDGNSPFDDRNGNFLVRKILGGNHTRLDLVTVAP